MAMEKQELEEQSPEMESHGAGGAGEKFLILWRNGWRWYDYETPEEDETTDDEFREWYLREIMEVL